MSKPGDLKRVYSADTQWYKKIWTLSMQDMSWVEQTKEQVDFILDVLALHGNERVLDLACGYGRHSIELARRGFRVTGVDITPVFVEEAKKQAAVQGLTADFICADIREIRYKAEFDIVLNLADGAIGYLENEDENLKIFDRIAAALKPGGKHLMDINNGAYAAKHFPQRYWVYGSKTLALADFEWDPEKSRMLYGGLEFKCGEILPRPTEIHMGPIRVYNLQELAAIFKTRGMAICGAYEDFNTAIPATDDTLQMQVYAKKHWKV